jgi:mono/diheme cytochrome c family protein
MDIALSVTLGLLFLLTAFAAVFLMFHLWGYPFDKATRTSAAPPSLMRLHRVLGWSYAIIYVVMMWEMVPRLWEYQVELPARTVVHICLGLTIGVVLLIKISILRWFRHLEEWMPYLGVSLLLCTVLLCGLSIPFGLREFVLARSAAGAGVYSEESRARLATLLPFADFPDNADLAEIASPHGLREGRDVLVTKCVVCHDLKTILVQPRTPSNWWKTVDRMAQKPSFSDPMTLGEQYLVTGYLIAISGDLQKSAKEKRLQDQAKVTAIAEVRQEANAVAAQNPAAAPGVAPGPLELPPFDATAAKATYERVCTQCHGLEDIDARPPTSADEVKNLILRMIAENGMEATRAELDLVYLHLVSSFAGGRSK